MMFLLCTIGANSSWKWGAAVHALKSARGSEAGSPRVPSVEVNQRLADSEFKRKKEERKKKIIIKSIYDSYNLLSPTLFTS